MTEMLRNDGINKLLMGIIVALLTWNLNTTYKLSIDVAVLSSKLDRLEETMNVAKNS